VTNRHVHGLYGHYLLDQSDPGGIEFIAEKGKDASDFVPFNGQAPRLLPALDIAIYTLARPVKNRLPIQLKSVETEDLLGRDIVVIGYPDTHKPKGEAHQPRPSFSAQYRYRYTFGRRNTRYRIQDFKIHDVRYLS